MIIIITRGDFMVGPPLFGSPPAELAWGTAAQLTTQRSFFFSFITISTIIRSMVIVIVIIIIIIDSSSSSSSSSSIIIIREMGGFSWVANEGTLTLTKTPE